MKYSLSIQHSLGQMKQESPWRSPRQRTKDVVWEDLLLKTEGAGREVLSYCEASSRE